MFFAAVMLILTAFALEAKVQKGVVRSLSRPGKKIEYVSDVTIMVKGLPNRVKSGSGGRFSVEMRPLNLQVGSPFYILSAKKSGYKLADTRKTYVHSGTVPAEIIMINLAQQQADIQRITEKNTAKLAANYERKIKRLEKDLKEKRITAEKYREELQAQQEHYERFSDLIDVLAERYSSIDYENIDPLNARINEAIENGEYERADSLINSVGSLEEMEQSILADKENALERKNVGAKIVEDADSDLQVIGRRVDNLADLYYNKSVIKLEAAERDSAAYYLARRAALDPDNPQWQIDAGEIYQEYLADYEKAMQYYQKALSYINYTEKNESLIAAYCYNNIGLLYQLLGKYKAAHDYLLKSLNILINDKYGENGLAIATNYGNTGSLYMSEGDYQNAMLNFEKAIELKRSNNDSETLDIASSYNNLGVLYANIRQFEEALKYYNKALIIRVNLLGYNSPKVGTVLSNIGSAYDALGNDTLALDNLKKALNIKVACFGENHPSVATTYNNIGNVLVDTGNYDDAIFYIDKALGIARNCFGDYHNLVATYLNSLGNLYFKCEQYESALDYYEQALKIKTDCLGGAHQDVGVCYSNIGSVYYLQNNYIDSKRYFEIALQIYQNLFGNNHQTVKDIKKILTNLQLKINI